MNPFRPAGRASVERTPIRAELPSSKTSGTVATLRLYDPIDSWGEWWGVSAKEFTRVLDELPDDISEIRLLINSPGGEVFEGIAIMNALRSHPAKITAVVEGIAASSASFIAAAADELVMMQNSQLYIHNAWAIAIGDAVELREVAAELEASFDRNIASVYAAKSGDTVEHWLAEMDKDRFLTAEEAVAEKLADRIEGVGDAEAAKAKFDLSVFARKNGRRAAAHVDAQTPDSTEPGTPIQKEELTVSDTIKAGIIERLGVTDADASDEAVLAALDEALAEQADTPAAPAATIPDGAIVMDKALHDQLRADADKGRQAMEAIDAQRRDQIIADAMNDGRIAASAKDGWRAQLDKDEDGIKALLESFPKNAVPVEEIGHADTLTSADDALYGSVYGSTEKEA
ncbi:MULTISPECIES: head maturation protease, ClpP-related [unclassified Microbacterium]|uniref:head maturation protease, ClpP-related n=1 Tax=unclassified Microbacterium TaxID=2609290 RepID=UPI00300FA634